MYFRITSVSLVLCLGLLGLPAAPTQRRAVASGKPLTVKLYVDQLVCNHITKEEAIPIVGSNDRDEVYIKVHASSPKEGKTNERLPLYKDNDDYYEFTKDKRATKDRPGSWTNHDQAPVGAPILWSGTLQPGEHAEVLALIGEQDNKDLKDIKMGIQGALTVLSNTVGQVNPYVKAALEAAKAASEVMPENTKDDAIGAFHVSVRNNDGRLEAIFIAPKLMKFTGPISATTTFKQDNNAIVERLGENGIASAAFDFKGTGAARYEGVVAAEVVGEVAQTRTYLGKEHDACRQPYLYVTAGEGPEVEVTWGSVGIVRVGNPRFSWLCPDRPRNQYNTRDWTTAPTGTNLVIVKRDPASGSGGIDWYCFKEVRP